MNLIQYVASYGDLLPPEEPEAKRSSTTQKRKVSDLWFIIDSLRDKWIDQPALVSWYQPYRWSSNRNVRVQQSLMGNNYAEFSVKHLLLYLKKKIHISKKQIYIVHWHICSPLVTLIRVFSTPPYLICRFWQTEAPSRTTSLTPLLAETEQQMLQDLMSEAMEEMDGQQVPGTQQNGKHSLKNMFLWAFVKFFYEYLLSYCHIFQTIGHIKRN